MTADSRNNLPDSRGGEGVRARSLRREQVPVVEKTKTVLRLLGGEPLQALSDETGVSTRRIERWKDEFVAGGSEALARRKDLGPPGWWAKNSGAIRQWLFLVLALVIFIRLLTYRSH